ncbi:Tegument antigen [Fasciolopsis buskii]|uniref:Tegument antigen n=1 Tax=Fasciolopsis buskii TaxID=27845 RepID=A0A8E0S072_9TREM|nr:Tegument antigen [Fasciolopsis buski]
MDAFLEAFCALDEDNREVISLDDLHSYNSKHNLEDTFPQKFMSVFDTENSGTITMDQFCRTLGLVPKNVRDFRRRRTTHMLEELTPPDLEMVHDDMDIEIKLRIYRDLLNDLRQAGQQTNINVTHLDTAVKRLKKYLESVHGRAWQIIISINQQLAWFNYLPGYMLHFCLGRFAVLIWKTPAE